MHITMIMDPLLGKLPKRRGDVQKDDTEPLVGRRVQHSRHTLGGRSALQLEHFIEPGNWSGFDELKYDRGGDQCEVAESVMLLEGNCMCADDEDWVEYDPQHFGSYVRAFLDGTITVHEHSGSTMGTNSASCHNAA